MEVLKYIKENIGNNADLSEYEKNKIKRWVNLSDDNKNLIDQGKADMREIATRVRENFHSIFSEPFNPNKHKVTHLIIS